MDHDDEEQPHEPDSPRTEGVRILGAQEAAEAVARGEAGRRRSPGPEGHSDEPGDDHADSDERPVLRFPSSITSRDPSSFGSVPVVRADEPPPSESAPEPDDGLDVSGSFELPHYSDPPTGQVPEVVIAEGDEATESWATLSGPRWRDDPDAFDDEDDFSDLIDSGPRLGALDARAPSAGGFFDDDLDAVTSGYGDDEDVIPATRRAAARTATRRQRPAGRGTGGGSGEPPAGASGAGRNLPQAIAVGVALLVVGIVCFSLGAIATTILIAAILTLCAIELFGTLRSAGYNPATLLGVVAVPSFAVAASADPAYGYPVVIGLTVVAAMVWFFWVHPGQGAVGNLGVTLLAVAWIGGLGSFGTLMLGVGRVAEDAGSLKSNPGIGVLWAVVLITVCYDVGAYAIGRMIGHTPLSSASPSKTVEGLIGGFAAALFIPFLILMFIGGGIHPIGTEFARAFPFCLFCAIAAPAGDLCESAIKRDLDVKDMGTLLPGHGGVLDRFDGFLFVLPTAWVMAHLLQVSPF